jgi:hypothetical protein
MLEKNKKGNIGTGLLYGLITAVMVFLMLSAFLPTIIEMLGTGKGDNSANCPGYIDPDATSTVNYSYDSSKTTDRITCSILDFTPGMLVLSVVFAVIAGIISGRIAGSMEQQQQQYYPQYG